MKRYQTGEKLNPGVPKGRWARMPRVPQKRIRPKMQFPVLEIPSSTNNKRGKKELSGTCKKMNVCSILDKHATKKRHVGWKQSSDETDGNDWSWGLGKTVTKNGGSEVSCKEKETRGCLREDKTGARAHATSRRYTGKENKSWNPAAKPTGKRAWVAISPRKGGERD